MPRGRIPNHGKVKPMPAPKYKRWPLPVIGSMDTGNIVPLPFGYAWLSCSCCGRIMPCRFRRESFCEDCFEIKGEVLAR